MSVEVTQAIGARLPELLPDPESFEANRASTEASILGFAEILEQGADPAGTSLGAATLAYAQEGAHRGIPLTTLIRSYRLGHAAAWEGITALIAAHAGDPEQRAVATELCSAWLFAYVDAALCLAEDFYSAERERWVRSAAATRAETIDTILAGGPIDAAWPVDASATSSTGAHSRGRVAASTRGGARYPRGDGSRDRGAPRSPRRHTRARPPARHPVDRRVDRHSRGRLGPPAG